MNLRRALPCLLHCFAALAIAATDPRNFDTGRLIPDESYCDQPYLVITKDGNWLCTLTTGTGREGAGGQHVVATISSDQGGLEWPVPFTAFGRRGAARGAISPRCNPFPLT